MLTNFDRFPIDRGVIYRWIFPALAFCSILIVNRAVGQTKSTSSAVKDEVAASKAMPPMRGILFHFCSCAVPCSCMFTSKNADGCNIVRVFHVTDGGYLGKHIVGLTMVYVTRPEELKTKKNGLKKDGEPVGAVVYLPTGMTKQQENNLKGTLQENMMSAAMTDVVFRHAPIRFTKLADGYEVEIPKIFHAKTQGVKGANGKPMTADNLAVEEGSHWYIGRSSVHDYQDSEEKAWHWKLPHSNGSWSMFAWGPHIDPSDESEAKETEVIKK